MAEVPKSIKASLYIDGKPAEASLKNIRQVTVGLRRELSNLTVGTEEWNRKMKELQLHERTLQNIQNEIKGVGGAFGWLKTEIGKLGALAVGYLGFQFITSQFQNIILSNAKLSDSLADVRRVAGLTEQEVLNLNKSFKDLDTRTSSAGLREIAIIAGKLGVAKDDILGFVEATDKLVVTLGDELGNADQITTQLGKILNVYDGKVTGENITHLGNAMVVMANAGVASGGFIAEFTQRVSGIAKTANLSLGATIGLAAGLEELGGKSESASTAVSRLLTDIAGDLPKAARLAKVPLQEFQKLFAESPEKALIRYAVGLTQNKQAFADVSAAFKDAGEEGSRVVATLSAIGNKAEFMQGKIDLANESLTKNDAINQGFALKNETFGATVDKLGKKFSELSANKGLIGFLQGLVIVTGKVIDSINNNAQAISRLVKVAIIGGAAWVTYSLYVGLAKSATFSFIAALIKGESVMALSRTAGLALAVVKYTLAGNMTKAAQAARLFNVAIAANPIGLMLAAITATIIAVALFKDTTNDAAKAQETLNKIKAAGTEKIAEEKDRIKALTEIILDQNEAYTDRIAAINSLRKLLPDHLQAYTDEQILAGDAKVAVDAYVRSLEKRADAEVAYEELRALRKEQREIERSDEDVTFLQGVGAVLRDFTFDGGKSGTDYANKSGADNKANALRINKLKQDAITNQYKESIKQEVINPGPDGGGLSPTNAAAKTLDNLNAKLADLRKQKGAAIIGSKEYLGLVKEIAALEKEIAKYDGSADKKSGKKEESLAKKQLKEFEALGKAQKELNTSLLNDQLSKNQKELAQEGQKYQTLIDKEKSFLSEKGITKEQKAATSKAIGDLEAQRDEALRNMAVRQEAEMTQKIKDLRISLGNMHETEYQKEVSRINQFYDQLETDSVGNEIVLARLRLERKKDLTQAEINEKKRLQDEIDRIEGGSDVASAKKDKLRLARINKKYDDEIEALKQRFSEELQVTKEFQDALNLINANRKSETDKETAAQKKEYKDAAVQAAETISNAVFQIGANNRRAETEANLKAIEDKRTAELSAKNLTEAQKDAINKKYDKKVKDEKLRAWKADKAAAQTQNVINTALAVTKALPNFILAGLAAASGIAQGIVIASEKPPQFAQGGMSDSDPAGYVGQATIFKKSASGRPFMAGEAGREWIAPSWMLQNPRTANLINMLEVVRKEKRGFANGGFNDNNMSSGTGIDTSIFAAQMAIMVKQTEHLENLSKEFKAFKEKPWDFNMRTFQEKKDEIDEMTMRATA